MNNFQRLPASFVDFYCNTPYVLAVFVITLIFVKQCFSRVAVTAKVVLVVVGNFNSSERILA